jgi:excisionase family DNA binding protein
MTNLKLLDITEAAELLGRTPGWVRRLIHEGAIKTVSGSRRLVVTESELERFVAVTAPYVPRRGRYKRKAAAK